MYPIVCAAQAIRFVYFCLFVYLGLFICLLQIRSLLTFGNQNSWIWHIKFMTTVPTFAVDNALRDDIALRALSTLRGLRGAPEVPPLCRETQSLGQQMLERWINGSRSAVPFVVPLKLS